MRSILKCILVLITLAIAVTDLPARKVKQSLKITTEKKKSSSTDSIGIEDQRKKLSANGTVSVTMPNDTSVLFCPDSITFAGYEKEVNSATESFLIVNNSDIEICGIEIKIIYKDLKDRMLHSRTLSQSCVVPPKETRKIYFKSWDLQKTYYYYLGNEPRKVATPYKIEIVPLAFFTEN